MDSGQQSSLATVGVRRETQLAWLALVLTPGIGTTRTWKVIRRLGAPERLFEASLTDLENLGMAAHSAQFIFDRKARAAAEEELSRVAQSGGQILTAGDDEYPEQLKNIYDPPAVLWVRGSAELLSRPGIAVVGTRHPSTYGAGMAEMLSRDLAVRRLVIFSGMARGVDTAAHKGALAARGQTVAVWGTGIDVVYPKENKRLAEQIVEVGGTIISEFPLGTFPAPQNFPIRNRVLSGLSIGVLVIEAAEHSGTRITARLAMEQGRDVYAVPGNVTNKNAWGPNTLIKQGAKLTATWEDVWEDLPSPIRSQLEEEMGVTSSSESNQQHPASLFNAIELNEQEKRVLERLRADEGTQLDELIEALEGDLNSGEIFTALFELELAGRVRQLPGKNYVRTM
jgi:DNA processing protein